MILLLQAIAYKYNFVISLLLITEPPWPMHRSGIFLVRKAFELKRSNLPQETEVLP